MLAIRVLGFMAAAYGTIIFIIFMVTSYDCGRYQEETGRATKMGAMACYVQHRGVWFTRDEYKLQVVQP